MDVTRAEPLDAAAAPTGDRVVYRVRLWVEPAAPSAAWMVDEWDLNDATDVSEVISWASAQSANAFEVFLRWDDHAQTVDGEVVVRHRFTRLQGSPQDDGGTHEPVVLVADE